MKVALVDQIAEAERHRDDLEADAIGNPDAVERLHRAEGIVLTLNFVQTYEQGFREFSVRDRRPVNEPARMA